MLGKKNYTFTTTNVNNNIMKNIENHFEFNKTKNSNININLHNKKQINQIMKEDNESEDKKTDVIQNEDVNDEKSQLTDNKNEFFNDENYGNININEDIKRKKV